MARGSLIMAQQFTVIDRREQGAGGGGRRRQGGGEDHDEAHGQPWLVEQPCRWISGKAVVLRNFQIITVHG